MQSAHFEKWCHCASTLTCLVWLKCSEITVSQKLCHKLSSVFILWVCNCIFHGEIAAKWLFSSDATFGFANPLVSYGIKNRRTDCDSADNKVVKQKREDGAPGMFYEVYSKSALCRAHVSKWAIGVREETVGGRLRMTTDDECYERRLQRLKSYQIMAL